MEAEIGQQFAMEGHSKVSPCSFTGHLIKTRKDLSKCLEAAIGQQLARTGRTLTRASKDSSSSVANRAGQQSLGSAGWLSLDTIIANLQIGHTPIAGAT